jgi:hypothetical protein
MASTIVATSYKSEQRNRSIITDANSNKNNIRS